MNNAINVTLCAAFFAGMLLVYALAFQVGRQGIKTAAKPAPIEGTVIGAIFALLGLLIAFTFSGAFSRYTDRRHLIIQEAIAIQTAFLRLDLLPPEAQPAMRENLRKYTASRARLYYLLSDQEAMQRELANTAVLQKAIWSQTVAATQGPGYQPSRVLLMPAINEMFDLVTERSISIRTHTPIFVYIALCVIALTCAAITGHRASVSHDPRHLFPTAFAAVIAFTLYLILDIEYPGRGLVNLNEVNQVLVVLEKRMQ